MRLARASTPTLAAGCFSRKTNNGKKAKQAEWNRKIEEMLNELEPASDY
jgi:hypothetical protein